MPDFVRVVNTDERPFTYHHLNNRKRLQPGKETMMPWDLAITLFGDPFAANAEKKPDRTDSLRRARSNYNFELGMETMESFDRRRPHMEVYDMETNQRIYMLIEDPDGDHVEDFVRPDDDGLDPMVAMQRQIAQLTAQLTTLIDQRSTEGQQSIASTDMPANDQPASAPTAEFINGQWNAQRPEDAASAPLFDFAALATMGPDDIPPYFAPGAPGQASTDNPRDAGVGSPGADEPPAPADVAQTPRKLAPKPN